MPNTKNPVKNMSKERAYFYVYEMAKKYGDKFPEVVAAQFQLESASGTSDVFVRTNNPFGQTTLTKNDAPAFKDKNGTQYYWKKYDSLDDAIKDRSTGKWSKKYKSANNPINAMAIIQPEYAPSDHDNGHYMSSIANILKSNGFYNGNTDLPNPDKNPNFYKNSKYNNEAKSFNLTQEFKDKVFKDYLSEIENIKKEPNEKLRQIKLDELNREQYKKGYVTSDVNGNPSGFLNQMLEVYDLKTNEENRKSRVKKLKIEKRNNKVKYGERAEGVKKLDAIKDVRTNPIKTLKQEPEITTQNSLIKINPEWNNQDSIDEAVNDEVVDQNEASETSKPVEGSDLAQFNKKAADSFGSFLDKEELIVPDTFEYNEDDYKKELPIGALAQGALGLIGLSDAETELPLRDEQVSEAILNYAKTNKKIAEMGLRPEEEAMMKNQIAEVYQEGMSNLVRASAGNRNLVLGNSNSLNLNRLKGIANISAMDIQRKDSALEKYGQTLQYIENFNTNRDVANHSIKLSEAQQKRQAGSQLAASGFASMIEELQYQKENGPGSANHMLKQQLMYSSFGVVPGMADDGTGTKPGTISYAKAQKEAIEKENISINQDNEINNAFKAKVNSLSDEEKTSLNKSGFWQKAQDPNMRKSYVETGIMALPEPSPISEVSQEEILNPQEEPVSKGRGFFSF